MTYRLVDGDDTVRTHEVIFRTAPLDESTAAAMLSGDDQSVRWVTELDETAITADNPDDIGDEAEDIRLFLP